MIGGRLKHTPFTYGGYCVLKNRFVDDMINLDSETFICLMPAFIQSSICFSYFSIIVCIVAAITALINSVTKADYLITTVALLLGSIALSIISEVMQKKLNNIIKRKKL